MKQIFTRRTQSLSASGTRYCHPWGGGLTAWSSVETVVYAPASAPGTLSNLRVTNSAAPGVGIAAIYTIMVAGVASSLSCVITHPATSAQDTLNTATIAAGQTISLRRTTTGGNPAAATVAIAMEFDGDNVGQSQYGGTLDLLNNAAAQYFNPLACPGTSESTNIEHTIALWPIAGNITRLDTIINASNVGNVRVTALRKNGITQDGTGGTVDTRVTVTHPTLTGSSSFSLPMAADDTLSLITTPTGTTTGSPLMGVNFAFTATTDGEFAICIASDPAVSNSVANYSAGSGENWSTSATVNENIGSVTPLLLQGIRGLLLNGADDGRTLGLVKNGTQQVAPIATWASASVNAVGAGTVTITSADTWAAFTLPGTVPNTRRMTYAIPGIAEEEPPPPDPDEPPPEGGGEVEPGPQPEPGVVPTFPLLFARIKDVNGDHAFVFAETWLNDDFDWYGGKKAGKLANVSPLTRRLSRDGAFDGVRFTVTIADSDRLFREYVATNPLRGMTVELFLIDDASRRAASGPTTPPAFRIGCGRVTGHGTKPNWGYDLHVLDVLSQRLAEFNKQPMIPPDVLTAAQFPDIDPALEGRAAPIAIGRVVDTDGNTLGDPQGAAPILLIVGTTQGFNLSAIGGINHEVDVYLLTRGAIPHGGIFDGFYNEPDTPSVRQVIPEDAYGVHIWVPHKPGWTTGTGQTDHFIVYQNGTYTPVFISRTVTIAGLNVAQAIREGRILIAFNIVGVDETGTSEGRYIDYPPRIWQWLLQNYVFNRYMTGAYFAMPLLEGTYGVIDWESVEAVVNNQAARLVGRYVSGFILGGDGKQRAVFDILGELCRGSDMDQGINRHGQLMLSAEDLNAEPEILYDATLDIEDEQFETWIEPADYVNRIEFEYGYYYVAPYAPNPLPPETGPTPTKPISPYPEFQSRVVTVDDTLSQTAVGGEILVQSSKNYVTRQTQTAEDVALHGLWRGVGIALDGPRMFRFTGGYRLLGEDTTIVELGTTIGYTHPEKIGGPLVVESCRVMAMTVDPIRKRVTLEGLVLNTTVL